MTYHYDIGFWIQRKNNKYVRVYTESVWENICMYKEPAGILTLDFTTDLVGLCWRQDFNSNNKKILNGT